jgi:hypothetical protein
MLQADKLELPLDSLVQDKVQAARVGTLDKVLHDQLAVPKHPFFLPTAAISSHLHQNPCGEI